MSEIERLKKRRRRRQEAFSALAEIDDLTKNLLNALEMIGGRVQELSTRRWYFLLHPTRLSRFLAELAEHSAKKSLLAEITKRVEAIRGEFGSLQLSDERELKELEAISRPPTPPTGNRAL